MANEVANEALSLKVRRAYLDGVIAGIGGVVQAIEQTSRHLLTTVSEPAMAASRRAAVEALTAGSARWSKHATDALRAAQQSGMVQSGLVSGALPMLAGAAAPQPREPAKLSLVENDTIEAEILSSRLALAMMDRASWEFTDLRSRINHLESKQELAPNDVLRPHVLARVVTSAWMSAGIDQAVWRTIQASIHDEFGHFVAERYHDANRWLVESGVMAEIDLRPLIRRTVDGGRVNGGGGDASGAGRTSARSESPMRGGGGAGGSGIGSGLQGNPRPDANWFSKSADGRFGDQGAAVLERLNRLIGQQIPEFAQTSRGQAQASPGLKAALIEVQAGLQRRFQAAGGNDAAGATVSPPALVDELRSRSRELKQAAGTLGERAIIEIVALLFQSILTDELIPATVRVWFARLQMPVLRVAVGEPDFFATVDHPARRLIDRMGACVMGFETQGRNAGDVVEKEIKRVVQVVEAYPDTGRRVFQTVLVEFERFLEHYFRTENEASKRGVSLAQQVEQRETLAIQYTIELRKMLDQMPVQEGVREFLFQVWADVLAMSAVKSGLQSDETKLFKRAAADLIWSAGAKVSREERAEVIRRLPPLLKVVRDGMEHAKVPTAKQNEHLQRLNNSLAAAFTARAAAIPANRLAELTLQLETLEELLPDASEMDIDESLVLDLSGHESSDLEIVSDGGSAPTAAMLSWAKELQVGSWYRLDYRQGVDGVQLAWQGMKKQLSLFVSPQGRGILFQQHRLAAFLQAGLLVPVQTESLTVKATRDALEKLDLDPHRLLQ